MIEFFNRLFGRQNSGATAKERLRLVLMSDHLSLAPEMIESMKRDLIDVISRYVEVDRSKIDVHFENQDNALAMLANIPITGVSRNNGNGNGNGTHADEQHADEPAPAPLEANAANAMRHAEPTLCHPEPVEGRPSNVEATPTQKHRSGTRKRRKRSGGGGQQASGTPAPAT
jgi:cell division topological specificity factor